MEEHAQRRTKIVCTMGPSVQAPEDIHALLDAGMNVARLNFSHGTQEEHGKTIALLQRIRQERGVPLAIMLDTKGPEIRVGASWEARTFELGERVALVPEGSKGGIPIQPMEVLSALQEGTSVFFDDGYLQAVVIEAALDEVVIEFLNGGILKPRKGLNLPGSTSPLPALTEQDRSDLIFGVEQGVDLVAASFIRSAEHLAEIRRCLASAGGSHIKVIAKIENEEGLHAFDAILQASDGIMVARGDLGVELPIARIPRLQKLMIKKCVEAGRPVVTATQMLESMIHSPRPTRAEASDVANAIYDGTSAVMLSGETAAGAFPIQAVHVMHEVTIEAEHDINYREIHPLPPQRNYDITTAVALAAVKTAYASNAQAIVAFTQTGSSARLLSRLRPAIPIYAFTDQESTFHQMSLLWGVSPMLMQRHESLHSALEAVSLQVRRDGLLQVGDLIVVISGSPFGERGSTNNMLVHTIGDILLRHGSGVGGSCRGRLSIDKPPSDRHGIVMLSDFSPEQTDLIMGAAAVVLMGQKARFQAEDQLIAWAISTGISMLFFEEEHVDPSWEGLEVCVDPAHGWLMRVAEDQD